jgi:large subunit ribosomal protein L24
MKIKKGDTVLITSGKDRGRKGKVLEASPKESRILVEGINLRKKHQRPKKSGEKGQIVEMPGPIHISDIKLICPKCGKATKVGYKVFNKNKVRVCKKCGQEI